MSKFAGILILAIFGLFWCGITFTIDGFLAGNLVRQLRAGNYPAVTGTVTHSELKVESDGEGTSYLAKIHYRYVVDGKTHESASIRFDYMSFGRQQAEALVRKYPVGQVVTVHYDPAEHHRAVLELGPDLSNYFAALFLTPFNAIALGLIGAIGISLRSMWLGRPIVGISLRDDGLTTTIRIYERSPTISALVAWGGAGFVAVFGVMFASWLMPMEYALALGWSATLAATFIAWRSARKKYSEIRLDALRGRLDIRDTDGRTFSLSRDDVQPISYSPHTTTDSEGDKSTKFQLGLSYLDPESRESRTLVLPVKSSANEAESFTSWLNGLLQLPHMGKGLRRKGE